MKYQLKPYLGHSYPVSQDFFDSLKELRKQSVDFNHAWGIINNRRYRKNFGAMFAGGLKGLIELMYYEEVDMDVMYYDGRLKHVEKCKNLELLEADNE
ncbi:hypothetical protein [Companilactobacillus mishanensis]|uniref:Phage protein n=1 Tax=Companilactobacillus mishanensis TaxID=2486008 RepID=A0ABW9P404_9LACO|nr:hypothetical protein [Companilactobacillus mishanensis]MQS43970.1 hypothetical protein [Companilactobacillus mishanensis]